MCPILFKATILGREIIAGTYGFFMLLAFVCGILLSAYIAGRLGFRRGDFIYNLFLISAGIIAGALIAGFFVFLPERIRGGFLTYPAALVSWGGMLGGGAALALVVRFWNESFLAMADACTPGYLVGLGIGRIGCHFAGCCYGMHTASWIGVTFTDPAAPASAMNQPLVPAQLMSAAFLIAAGLVFIPVVLRGPATGLVFGASAIAYAVFRYSIEYWRDDPRKFFYAFSDGQIFSMACCAFGIVVVIYSCLKKRHRGEKDPPADRAESRDAFK